MALALACGRLHCGRSRQGWEGAQAPGSAFRVLERTASAPSRLDALRGVSAPTLIVHGRRNRFFVASHATALAGALPDARLISTEGGHGFPFEMYSDHLAAIVESLQPGERAWR